MKKLFALAAVGAAAGVGAARALYPDDFDRALLAARHAAERAWVNVEGNPVPVLVALGTFVATIVYHKLKGKSLRESVEVAATRVTLVQVPAAEAGGETPVVTRAKARATYTQLLADQVALENRGRKLPGEVKQAERDACYSEQALADARAVLEAKQKAHEEAAAKLEALRRELAASQAELAAIAGELKKLSEVV
jgi:hypothetical protein